MKKRTLVLATKVPIKVKSNLYFKIFNIKELKMRTSSVPFHCFTDLNE